METNFNIGQTVIVNKKSYTIKQLEVTAEKYPNIKRNNPDINFHVIIEGKKGALKAGFITITGNIVLF